MACVLGTNRYGKSGIHLLKVTRDGPRHTIVDFLVSVSLEGDFADIHTKGDNSKCLPTDTMKNTVYALAKDDPIISIESFGLRLARHFSTNNPQVALAQVGIVQAPWDRAAVAGKPHPHCFTRGPAESATCTVAITADGAPTTQSGIADLVILKSTDSAFSGFPRDQFTTLPETQDRIFCTSLSVRWDYTAASKGAAVDFTSCRAAIRTTLIETFATHQSKSVQHTLHAMGQAALDGCSAIARITLTMPNKHCLLFDLSRFGMENNNEVFVPTTEPYGLIEATLERC